MRSRAYCFPKRPLPSASLCVDSAPGCSEAVEIGMSRSPRARCPARSPRTCPRHPPARAERLPGLRSPKGPAPPPDSLPSLRETKPTTSQVLVSAACTAAFGAPRPRQDPRGNARFPSEPPRPHPPSSQRLAGVGAVNVNFLNPRRSSSALLGSTSSKDPFFWRGWPLRFRTSMTARGPLAVAADGYCQHHRSLHQERP